MSHPLEGREDARQLLFAHAHAGVFDLDAQPRRRLEANPQHDAAAIGELDGVAQQVQQHLAQPPLVGMDHRGQVARAIADELQPRLLLGLDPDDAPDDVQEPGELQVHRHDLQPTGLDLGEVEDVVDQRQQVFAALMDGVDARQLAFAERLVPLQDLREAEDAVQRRAQVMAHVGEERALRLVGDLGALLGGNRLRGAFAHQVLEVVAVAAQLFLGALALVDPGVQRVDGLRQLGGPLGDARLEFGMRFAQGLLGAAATDRVADRAHEQRAVDLALDEVVLRAGLQGANRDAFVGEAAEHNQCGHPHVLREQALQRLEAGALSTGLVT
jgi:hypothetical protein